MTGSEDFQIINSDGYHSADDRLDRLREIYQNETCKSAIARTRRAETNAKALEVILQAQTEEEQSSIPTTSSSEAIQMELEDTCTRLANRIKEVETLRCQIADLTSLQAIDNQNIESLQESLERLHRVSGEYRTDRDNLSNQLIGLFNSVKNAAGKDENFSMDELKKKLDEKQLFLVDFMTINEFQETRDTIAELEQRVSFRDVEIVNKQSQIDDLTDSVNEMKLTTRNLNSQIAHLGQTNETLKDDIEAHAAQVAEYETRINEWSDWAASVTADLESRNKEIELLEEFKKHATEEIALLDERMREMTDGGEGATSEKILELETEKMELEKKIYDWSEWAEAITCEMNELKASNESCQQDLEQLRAENVDKKAQLESVRDSMAELKSQLTAKEMEIENLKSVEGELKLAESKIANLSHQLLISENLATGAAEQLLSEKADLEKQCEEFRAKLLVRDSTIRALGKEIDAERKIPVQVYEDPSRLAQIQSLEAEVLLLREAQGSVIKRESEIHKLHSQVAILNSELESVTGRIDQLEDEKESVENELEATRVELNNQRSELEKMLDEKVQFIQTEGEKIARLEAEIAEKTLMGETLRLEMEKKNDDERFARDSSETELVKLRTQLDESVVVADRLREQIRMLEENLSVPEIGQSSSLEAERADMEQKLIAWNKWADEVTGQLAERDATIADLMSGRENLDESLRQAEELRQRVSDLESTAVERERNLSDESPIGRKLDELEKANKEISELRDLLEKAQTVIPQSSSPGVVSSEEAEVLLDAYRAEIDRLSKENSKLRTEVKKATSITESKQPTGASSSWWNVLPDIEDDENEISK